MLSPARLGLRSRGLLMVGALANVLNVAWTSSLGHRARRRTHRHCAHGGDQVNVSDVLNLQRLTCAMTKLLCSDVTAEE